MPSPSTTGYVDAAALFAQWLKDVLGYVNVTHELPLNLVFDMPLVVVERFGGGDQVPTIDVARIDVDTFTPDRASALAHGETIRQAARTQLPRYVYLDRTVVSKVEVVAAPRIVPYDSRNTVRRATLSLQLTLHQFSGI